MKIFLSYAVEAWLENAPADLHARIIEKLRFFAGQPDPLRFAERIFDPLPYRFRVGDYRAKFKLKDGAIHIVQIERRDKAYG